MPSALHIRNGRATDEAAVLAMWDKAIAWMVRRGQAKQWGTEPASDSPWCREMVAQWVRGSGMRIAEHESRPVGAAVVVDAAPAHVPPTDLRETYLLFLISDREVAGRGIGTELVRHVANDARACGCDVLRVDCWADAPELVAWYERQGFPPLGHVHGRDPRRLERPGL